MTLSRKEIQEKFYEGPSPNKQTATTSTGSSGDPPDHPQTFTGDDPANPEYWGDRPGIPYEAEGEGPDFNLRCPKCHNIFGKCSCGLQFGSQPLMTHGWICPVCGRGNSPAMLTCPCVNEMYWTSS